MVTNGRVCPTELDVPEGIRKDAIATQTSLYRALPACHGKNRRRSRDDVGAFHRMCFQRKVLDYSTSRENVAVLGETESPCFFVLPFPIILHLKSFVCGSLSRPFSLVLPQPVCICIVVADGPR